MAQIVVEYRNLGGAGMRRSFDTLEAAQHFAWRWVGLRPVLRSTKAQTPSGMREITCRGCAISDLFPDVRQQTP